MTDKLVLVGKIAGAFGVAGEVRLTAYTENPLALLNFRKLQREDGSHALTVLSGRSFKGGIIAKVKEVSDRTEAERLQGLKLYAPRTAFPALEAEEFYLTDLIGLRVETAAGLMLGKVKAVQNFGAGDLLEIEPGQGARSWYLPFTREAAPDVDIPGGRIVAAPPAEVSERD